MSGTKSIRAAVVAAAVAGLLGMSAAPALAAVPAPNKWTDPPALVPIADTTFGGVSVPAGLVPIAGSGSADFVPITGAPVYGFVPIGSDGTAPSVSLL
ncbi:hypothetical protein [Cryptosporangium phraense]|uniref:Uncharacterized protein n=1 Tax=Cryptosporangium phraense TaxID=2593070 RepID=A0A545AQE5_9ACTN|nr:hypothetical protein [Cryptosporangium phraense]TQS43546.1 hypothetical protein FL583_18065 [Cryptosporangium phraense]